MWYFPKKNGAYVAEETLAERQRRYRRERKVRDPEGWKRYRREMKRRMRERRRDPSRTRKGAVLAMTAAERREHYRLMRIRATYKLTTEQYRAMVERQGGRCAICDEQATLMVDHCHAKGAVRGLLCHYCNTGLGFFRDTPSFLEAAIRYLR